MCTTALQSGGVLAYGIATDLEGNTFVSGGASISPYIIGNDTMNGSLGPYVFTAKWSCVLNTGISALNNFREFELNIFPNPNSGHFSVTKKNIEDNSKLEIYNVLGKSIFDTNYAADQGRWFRYRERFRAWVWSGRRRISCAVAAF